MQIALKAIIIVLMKKLFIIFLCAVFVSGCSFGEANVVESDFVEEEAVEAVDNILIIVGEGGPSGGMFVKAANTFVKENGGDVYEVHNGDEFIAAIRDFVEKKGKINNLVYFGHGNHVGLYVNQAPNVNGALYANDIFQNEDWVAASIFEVPDDIFAKYGWIKFNGCNVADGYPEEDNLAQRFANYFDVDVVAPMGPTEFSTSQDFVAPIQNSKYLDPDFDGDVYMVPTYVGEGFVVVNPQIFNESGFDDVREGQNFEEAVKELKERGLDLDFVDNKFLPYNNITYAEAKEFCRVAVSDESLCYFPDYEDGDRIRNLAALSILADAYGAPIKSTFPWYDGYIWWANNEGVLTEDFTNKVRYTRSEMAELTWNFIQRF